MPDLPLETLATIFGVEHAPGRGVLFVEQHDCALSKASVVELESSNVDEQTAPTAYNDGELTFTVGAKGDEAIIFSHPVGATTVTGYADGVAISSGTVYVVPDAITYVVLMPRSIE